MDNDAVNSRKIMRPTSPRPQLSDLEARRIFESIDRCELSGLLYRALIALIFHNHLRREDVLRLKVGDLFWEGKHAYLRVHQRTRLGHREDEFAMPCFPEAEAALIAYVEKAEIAADLRGPLFRTLDHRTGRVTSKPLSSIAAGLSINQHARRAGIEREISLREFRVAGARLLKEQVSSGLII